MDTFFDMLKICTFQPRTILFERNHYILISRTKETFINKVTYPLARILVSSSLFVKFEKPYPCLWYHRTISQDVRSEINILNISHYIKNKFPFKRLQVYMLGREKCSQSLICQKKCPFRNIFFSVIFQSLATQK